MTDDEQLRHLLNRAIPSASDADVEQALARLYHENHGRRRWRYTGGPWLAAVATATAVVAIIGIAAVATRPGSHHAASPANAGSGVSAPGAWYRHSAGSVSTPTGTVDLGAVWVLRLSTPDSGTFDVQPHDRFGTGTLRYDPAARQWTARILSPYCAATAGRYRISQSGTSLIFAVVTDPCTVRRDALDGAVFAPLTNPNQLVG